MANEQNAAQPPEDQEQPSRKKENNPFSEDEKHGSGAIAVRLGTQRNVKAIPRYSPVVLGLKTIRRRMSGGRREANIIHC
jgi:hypothetical protein